MLMNIVNKECKQSQHYAVQEKDPKHCNEKKEQSKNLIEHPNKNDVLCGRGEKINSHFGNKTFRVLVSGRKAHYNVGKNEDKARISREILRIIANKGGKFLKQEGKYWVEVSMEKALKKTSQALREKQTNSYHINIPNMTTAAPAFRPVYQTVALSAQTNCARPRTPDIFADAEGIEDQSNWRDLYTSNKRKHFHTSSDPTAKVYANTLSQMRMVELNHQQNIANSMNQRTPQVTYTNHLIEPNIDSSKKRQKTTLNARKALRNDIHSSTLKHIQLSKEDAPLLEIVPANLLCYCFSFLPISSQVGLIDVCPQFQTVYKTNPSLVGPLKKYLEIQNQKLESYSQEKL